MRLWRVWMRNFIVYRRIWKMNFIPPLLEPMLYVFAFGYGLGGVIESVSYRGESMSYTAFISSGLVAATVMWHSFFETTYASYVRMYYQKTFDAMLSTPLTLEEIISAEIFWGATKSAMAASIMLIVLAAFGLMLKPLVFLVLPLAFLGGLAFGSLGMLFTAKTKSVDAFNLPVFLIITPMFLLSGTFFPVENFPEWAVWIAQVTPLYHLTDLVRQLGTGLYSSKAFFSLTYLALFAGVFFFFAIKGMRTRLVK